MAPVINRLTAVEVEDVGLFGSSVDIEINVRRCADGCPDK